MADSSVQKRCAKWVLDVWMPDRFGMQFSSEKLRMQNRGECKFDAVNTSETIIGNISTAKARTHRGSIGSGKKSKMRADALMLQLCQAQQKLLLLTEECMYELANLEQEAGRLPLDIVIHHVNLPDELKKELELAQNIASKELRGGT